MRSDVDLHDLTDEELSDHLDALLNEQERRARLVRVPEQVAQMTAQYVADGGDKAAIIDALSAEPPTRTEESVNAEAVLTPVGP